MACQAQQTHIDQSIDLQPGCSSQSRHGLATDLEAIVGAVWIDSQRDLEAVEAVMKRLKLYPSLT